jgi:hypothetical protein
MPIRIPQDLWQVVLRVLAWATRIPIALLIIFISGCFAYLGFFFFYRLTAWLYSSYLAHPWYEVQACLLILKTHLANRLGRLLLG